jgi:hypothetical protein
MTRFLKSIDDVVVLWERMEKMHPIPAFSIEWAIKKPGEDKALMGIIRRNYGSTSPDSAYIWEIWEVS